MSISLVILIDFYIPEALLVVFVGIHRFQVETIIEPFYSVFIQKNTY